MFTFVFLAANGIYYGSNSSDDAMRSTPQSPLRSVVRAFLPNQQRTTVHVQPGKTLRNALSKALTLRKLSSDICVVYKAGTKVSYIIAPIRH